MKRIKRKAIITIRSFVSAVFLFSSLNIHAAQQQSETTTAPHFTPPTTLVNMGKDWLQKKIQHDIKWAKDVDVALTLDQHLYPALAPLIKQFATEKGIKIALQEGTCGISAGLLSKKHVDIGGFCCPAGTMDRLPGLQYHTLGIAALGILVNAENPLQDVPATTIRDLFRGEIRSWSKLLTDRKSSTFSQPVRVIARFHCKHRPGHWRQILDNEELFNLRTDEVASIEDMISKITQIKGAIGYEVLWNIAHYQADKKAKPLHIGGANPSRTADVISGRYPFYRVYNITSWGPESGVEKTEAAALVQYILTHLDEVDPNFGLIPAYQLRKAGWLFREDELTGTPRSGQSTQQDSGKTLEIL